jgi:hypothetical protein
MSLKSMLAGYLGATRPEACERCRYGRGEPDGSIRCVRLAPYVHAFPTPPGGGPPVTILTYWPTVHAGQWCGDFEPKPELAN